jgi:hypothetical protein
MAELGEFPKISVREIRSFAGGEINCFGLTCEDGRLLRAAEVSDIRVKSKMSWLKKFDYLTRDPFDIPIAQGGTISVKLAGFSRDPESPSEFYNRASYFLGAIRNITNNYETVYENSLNIVRLGSEINKIPLYIYAHGENVKGEWFVGNNENAPERVAIPLESLLENIFEILRTVKSGEQTNFRDRYSLIALEACNPGHIDIRKDVVDKIGVPVLYSKDNILPMNNSSVPELITPKPL